MTIRQLEKPCFLLDPSPYGDDDYGIPHYAAQAEAVKALADLYDEYKGDPEGTARLKGVRVAGEDGPCWVAECDAPGCDEGYNDDEAGASHFETAAVLEEWIRPDGWTTTGPDLAYCWTCSPEGVAPPPSPAELEAAGQLVIPGVLP
jgi:hypothetical protein